MFVNLITSLSILEFALLAESIHIGLMENVYVMMDTLCHKPDAFLALQVLPSRKKQEPVFVTKDLIGSKILVFCVEIIKLSTKVKNLVSALMVSKD